MGVPEERLKRPESVSMEASQQKHTGAATTTKISAFSPSKLATAGVESPSPLPKMASVESPSSAASHTDSDDSVEVRVRSPLRKRPRDVISDVSSDVSSETAPKKRFRRDYEAAARLRDADEDADEEGKASAVRGCARHRLRVQFECGGCLEAVAQRFGWPAHALRPPPPPVAMPPTYLPLLDPLMGRIPQVPPQISQSPAGNPRLLGVPSSAALARCSPSPVTSEAPSVTSSQRVTSSPEVVMEDDAPLDLTRRKASNESTSDSSKSAKSRTSFSIESILADRKADAATRPPTACSPPRLAASTTSRSLISPTHIHPRLAAPPSLATVKLAKPSSARARVTPVAVPRRINSNNNMTLHNSNSNSNNSTASVPTPAATASSSGTDRRELANERERQRVRHLTGAFRELSTSVAGIATECTGAPALKFTKVAVLRTAALYIGYLTHVLREGAGRTEEDLYDKMRAAVLEVMTAKSKKGRDDDDDDENDE